MEAVGMSKKMPPPNGRNFRITGIMLEPFEPPPE
jgi:hypothetical protein